MLIPPTLWHLFSSSLLKGFPTDPLTILEPKNPLIEDIFVVQERRSADYDARIL